MGLSVWELVVIVAIIGFIVSRLSRPKPPMVGANQSLEERVARMERKLAGIANELSPADSEFEAELRDLIRQERKIEAIKLYREKTGAGLKEAKDAVDAMAEKM